MTRLTRRVGPDDHVLGDIDAPVMLVEYGDYECPLCKRAHAEVGEVLERMDRTVGFVYRHYPLTQLHPHALQAAEAAEAAGAQGRLWPMHDTLFENQTALEYDDLLGYAARLDLDTARFAEDLATHAHLFRVRADFGSGVRSGVAGTPTFFVDGVRLDTGWDADSLAQAVKSALRAKRAA